VVTNPPSASRWPACCESSDIGIDIEHRIIFGLSRFHDWLAQHSPKTFTAISTLPNSSTATSNSFSKLAGTVQNALDLTALAPIDLRDCLVGIGFSAGAVVVDGDFDAAFSHCGADQSTEVLGRGGDNC
jgi:hypothetical protein